MDVITKHINHFFSPNVHFTNVIIFNHTGSTKLEIWFPFYTQIQGLCI